MTVMRFELESDEAAGGKRALIIVPPDATSPELPFNIDTYQNISMSPAKEKAKKEAELNKLKLQLQHAVEVNDTVAIERINSQIKYSGSESIASQILKYVNDLLSRIHPDKAKLLYGYYTECWEIINSLTYSNLREVIRGLTMATTKLFSEVDLPQYCIDYIIQEKIPLPSDTNIGYKQHHSASKTFSVNDEEAPDYREMTAVSLLSKLMFPIWGHYGNAMKHASIGAIDKEFYWLQFIEPAIYKSSLARIYEKFKQYTFNEVRRVMERASRNPYGNDSAYDKNMFTISTLMFSESQFQMLNLAKLIVKRLVVFNMEISSLKGEDHVPNLMIFCQAIIEKNVTNTLKQINAASALLTRDEPRGSGDNNLTTMENTSRITKHTPDQPIYIRIGCDIHIPREVERRGFDLDEFRDAVDWYHGKRLLRRNAFSDAILSVYLFPIIGSSENLNSLKASQYIQAIVLAQLRLLHETDKTYGEELAVLLSAGQSLTPKENKITPVSSAIMATSEKSVAYRELMDRYPHSCEVIQFNESIIGSKLKGNVKDKIKGTINIAKHVSLIKDWLLDYDHYVNFCPKLWKYIPNISAKSRPKQNDILQYSTNVMDHYYDFILDNCPATIPTPTEGDKFFNELGYR